MQIDDCAKNKHTKYNYNAFYWIIIAAVGTSQHIGKVKVR